MGYKLGQTKIERFLKRFYHGKISVWDLKNKILTKEKYEEISDIIRKRRFDEIASGIEIFAEVSEITKDLTNYKLKLHHIKEPLELNRSLYEKKIIKGNIVKCTLEYTVLTETFSICLLEVLEFDEKALLDEFNDNMDGTISERVDYILSLLGIEGSKLMFREKLTYLVRLIPMVVKNYSLIEFSNSGLGKSTMYKNFEDNCYIADSLESDSKLFFNGLSKSVEIIKEYDVLVLDEIQKRPNGDPIFNSIQKFLEDGEVAKETGKKTVLHTSIVMLGNAMLKKNLDYEELFIEPKTNIFENHINFKKELLDRINYALPSWGCRKFSPDFKLSNDKDELSIKDVCYALRGTKINFDKYLKKHHKNLFSLSDRAVKSIKNTMEGFIKLLKLEKDEYELALYLAVEGRYAVENFIDIIEKKENKHEVLESILTKKNLKNLICSIEDISKREILAIGTHEIYYRDDNENITLKSLDTIGLEEIEIIKKYSDEEIGEYDEPFLIDLEDLSDYDELEDFNFKLDNELKEKFKLCEYQDDNMNYLYGYKFKKNIPLFIFRIYRNIKNENIICKDTNSCCKGSTLAVKISKLRCKECRKTYSYKDYREYLEKLI